MGEWKCVNSWLKRAQLLILARKGSKQSQPRAANRRRCFLRRVDKSRLSPLQDSECQKGIASPEKYLHTHTAISR